MTHADFPELAKTAVVVALPMKLKFRGITEREALLFEGANGWAEWSPFVEYDDAEARVWLDGALDQAFGPKREVGRVNLNATVPAVTDVASALSNFEDFDTVKIKVAEKGQSIDDDIARIEAVRRLYPDVKIRIDANGGYSVDDAMLVAERAGALDYFEQPCRSIGELAELRVRLRGAVRVAADESVRKVEDPMAVVHAGAADVLVLKAQPLGGVTNALAIARDCGLPVTVSSALETRVGLQAGFALATALGGNTAHGLATDNFFVNPEPFGQLASAERRKWWLERLERVLAI